MKTYMFFCVYFERNYLNIYQREKCFNKKLYRKIKDILHAQYNVSICLRGFKINKSYFFHVSSRNSRGAEPSLAELYTADPCTYSSEVVCPSVTLYQRLNRWTASFFGITWFLDFVYRLVFYRTHFGNWICFLRWGGGGHLICWAR
jgi:hypothetical protein